MLPRSLILRNLCCMADSDHLHAMIYMCKYSLKLYLFLPFCTHFYKIMNKYPKKFRLCKCVQLWEIICVPCIIKSSILIFQFCTLYYFIMSHVTKNYVVSCIHINTIDFLNITWTLAATNMILGTLECIFTHSNLLSTTNII